MCDGEHMFDCSSQKDVEKPNRQMSTELESFLARQFGDKNFKNFVAKKFHGYDVSYYSYVITFCIYYVNE